MTPSAGGSEKNTQASELGLGIARAISGGLAALTWARREDQWPVVDPQSGLVEDMFLIEALASSIESMPGVRRIS